MRKFLIPLLISTASTALMADDHLYGGFEVGATTSSDSELSRTVTGLSLEDDKRLGGMGGLYFGKAMGKWRMEGEFAFRKHGISTIDVTGPGANDLPLGKSRASGDVRSTSLMANAWYQVAGNEEWKFFAGLGLGIANIDVNNYHTGSKLIMDDSGWSTAGQAMLQVVHPMPGGLEFGVGARHFRTFENTMATSDGTAGYKVRNNEIFARLSWRFGEEAAPRRAEPAPMPAPMPAPTPVKATEQPAPVVTAPVVEEKKPEPKPVVIPGPFMVFFDFDNAKITPEAGRIIREAAKLFKEHKSVRLVATGHADRAGNERYNMALSERRAAAVKAALVAEGVDASLITTDAKGENVPLVSTDDGVREPQNRRAEIVIKR